MHGIKDMLEHTRGLIDVDHNVRYVHGEASRCGDGGKADMWLDHGPAIAGAASDFYNTNFFTSYAVDRVMHRNTSKPFWLHLTHQAVHTGDHRTPPVWELWPGDIKKDYISSLYVLDSGIANLTQVCSDTSTLHQLRSFLPVSCVLCLE